MHDEPTKKNRFFFLRLWSGGELFGVPRKHHSYFLEKNVGVFFFMLFQMENRRNVSGENRPQNFCYHKTSN